MADHSTACSGSAKLCQRLFDALHEKAANLTYEIGPNKCKITFPGARRVPVWVNSHSSRVPSLNVWFLGNPKPGMQFAGLIIRPRSMTESSWGEYGGSFMLTTEEQVEEAVEFLVNVSLPAAME